MAQKIIQFESKINPSLQVFDTAYVSTIDPITNITTEPQLLGKVLDVQTNSIVVELEGTVTLAAGMFLLFSKSIEVNESGLKGYYADVTFKNSSKKYAELFAISSEIVPSSK